MCAALVLPLVGRAVETAIKDTDGLTSWIYTPTSQPDPAKTYWLVVGVHGGSGIARGAAGVAGWATAMDDVIVLGPSFSMRNRTELDKSGSRAAETASLRDDFVMCGPVHEAKLKAQIAELRRHWNLHPKIMLHGFSGGAQFGHRFAFKNPDLVVAVSAHSAGL